MFKSGQIFRVASALALTSLLLLAHKPASAAIVSYDFMANVSYVGSGITSVLNNQTVAGTISYSDTGDNIISSDDFGTFGTRTRYDADVALSFSVNGKDGSSSGNPFAVSNFVNNDRYWIDRADGTFDNSDAQMFLLFNGDQNVISGTALPSELFLAGWTLAFLSVEARGFPDTIFQANLTSLTRVSAVPLPPSAILFGTALLGLAGLRRRKRKVA